MPSRPRKKQVDPVRVHVLTLVIFGVIAAVVLAIWTFPKFFLGLVLLAVSAVVYVRIYAFIETRLEAEEGRLAEELGFDLTELDVEDDDVTLDGDGVPARTRRAKPARRRKAAAPQAAEATAEADDAPAAATAEGKA